MLVVIVVAAATAFAFFVASYQHQVQAEETLNHDRSLESLKGIGLTELLCTPLNCNPRGTCSTVGGCFGSVSFTIASLDINKISLENLFFDHLPVVNYTASIRGSTVSPCFNASERSNSTYGVSACGPLIIPGYSTAIVTFNLGLCFAPNCTDRGYWALGPGEGPADLGSAGGFVLSAVTGLGNQFTESFLPPVPISTVFFVSNGTGSVPVFDGLGSYQPRGADNSSIILYGWTIVEAGTSVTVAVGAGGEFEVGTLTSGTPYNVTLTVTNSDGLSAAGTIPFEFS